MVSRILGTGMDGTGAKRETMSRRNIERALYDRGDAVVFVLAPTTSVRWLVEQRQLSNDGGVEYQLTNGRTTLFAVPEETLVRYAESVLSGV